MPILPREKDEILSDYLGIHKSNIEFYVEFSVNDKNAGQLIYRIEGHEPVHLNITVWIVREYTKQIYPGKILAYKLLNHNDRYVYFENIENVLKYVADNCQISMNV